MTVASCGSKRIATRILSMSCVVLLLASVGILMCSDSADAASTTKEVWGYVRDGLNQPVENSVVTVTMNWSAGGVRKVLSDTTDSDGYYSVVFATDEWDIGNRFDVVATYGGDQRHSLNNNADTQSKQQVDLEFPYAISQLGGIVGVMAAAGVLGVLAVAVLGRRRQPKSSI